MKTEEAEALADVLKELSDSYSDTTHTVREVISAVQAPKKLWRTGKRSVLIKLGLALIAFPDPTISDLVGTGLVAAGLVQEGIRRRALHVEDIGKTFQSAVKEIREARNNL
jgi:hypothetical protein